MGFTCGVFLFSEVVDFYHLCLKIHEMIKNDKK